MNRFFLLFFLLFFLSGCTVGDYVRPLLPGNIYLQDG
ncbi:lipoprotein, partial [Escherichia coli]|nr:lipoprotein [Escherichia coli]